MKPQNLFDNIPDRLPQELFTQLFDAPGLRIERIVSWGQCSEEDFWYDQNQDEWVLLIEGSAAVLFEGETEPVELSPGSFLQIPARRRHRVVRTDAERQTVWLAVHYG
ncbi:MAG: cupin domain-containing protein [Pirellulales bacterium]|nr:cupin domain-containing protein [Pirellulales bacterium]